LINFIQASTVVVILGAAIVLGRLLGPYVSKVFERTPSRLDKILDPVENTIYRLGGINPSRTMNWKQYAFAVMFLNIVQMAPGLNWDLAFMQVISFATNTNLQHYNGETTLSYLSQMSAVQFLQFTSAASGICVAVAFIRGFKVGTKDFGNFYVDFVRSLTRVLFPFCFIAAMIVVALGTPQSLSGYTTVKTVEGATQMILVGPVASLVSIMQIGTNGGGYYGANSAYPLENPTPATDVVQILLMLLMPTVMCFVFGEMLGKKKETRPILWGSYALFAIDLVIAFIPNSSTLLGPGMEVRFGGFFSSFWTVVTTAVTTGSVNSSLYGMNQFVIVAAYMGMLIQSTPGGKGIGLMYMVMYVVITVFIVGLMSGRTPEYLGMKINGRDVLIVMITFLVHPIIILIPTVMAFATGAANAIGVSGNALGFTQVLYEFTSAAANNGSDFFGSSANTVFFNLSTGFVMFAGRFAPILLLMALSGSMIGRKRHVEIGLKTDTATFIVVLVGSIEILVVLTFFPFLALGPILAWFQGHATGFG
jgi:K+-transporting ATPase ATPase A chain